MHKEWGFIVWTICKWCTNEYEIQLLSGDPIIHESSYPFNV